MIIQEQKSSKRSKLVLLYGERSVVLYKKQDLFHHDFEDLHVSFLHAVTAETSDVVDGLLYVVAHDAVAAEELVAFLGHLIAEDARLHGDGDLAGARGLGTVAYNAGGDAEGILQCVVDDIKTLAHEVGDAASRSTSRTHCTTVGGEPADAGLLVDGHQVGEGNGTDDAVLVDMVFLGVGEDG